MNATRRPASVPPSALALLLLLLPLADVRAGVKVQKVPAVVERRTFDPNSPPADLPELHGNESAVTTFAFSYGASMSYATAKRDLPGGRCRTTFRITGVEATIGLQVVVWLPEGASAKLTAHEEGHRELAERYYADAERAARAAVAKLDGRRIDGEGTDCERAAHEALDTANREVADAYRQQVADPCGVAERIYDDLTAHGTKKDPDEKTAIRQAAEQQAAEAKKSAGVGPQTKPATVATRPARRG